MKILEQILRDKSNRSSLIKEFQNLIWNDDKASDILSELAYDLDFYESNEELQKEEPSYYGDKELEEKIETAIQKVKYEKI